MGEKRGVSEAGAICMTEYSVKERKLIGYPKCIWDGGTTRGGGWIEGPYLYKHAGKYYLLCAEGGTGYHHCASMGRADTIWEPYEPDPKNPIITSILTDGSEGRTKAAEDYKFYNPDVTLQKSGHASIVETPDGRCYALVFTPVTAQASMSVG